jgi:beta-1,4-mannosyl-glycoprotein beta-1,4-N-acetylglucosaminyltransferase
MNKLVDCFTLFNELDLLEIRLKYLYDIVDYFVIVEADTSFSGESKKYFFIENIDRFLPYMDKIVFVPLEMRYFKSEKNVAWKREEYQRNSIIKGLDNIEIKDSDLVLISDVDELPNKDVLVELKKNTYKLDKTRVSDFVLFSRVSFYFIKRVFYKLIQKDSSKITNRIKLIYYALYKKYIPPFNFKMFNYYYYVNYQKKDSKWSGIQCVESRWLKVFTPDELRDFRNSPILSINNGGWHFSYLGGRDIIKHKIKNFSHQEYNIPQILSDEYIDFCIENGYSLFEYYKNPSTKPKYLKKEVSHLPKDLYDIIINYKRFILS